MVHLDRWDALGTLRHCFYHHTPCILYHSPIPFRLLSHRVQLTLYSSARTLLSWLIILFLCLFTYHWTFLLSISRRLHKFTHLLVALLSPNLLRCSVWEGITHLSVHTFSLDCISDLPGLTKTMPALLLIFIFFVETLIFNYLHLFEIVFSLLKRPYLFSSSSSAQHIWCQSWYN